jgi:hypothetical protein
MVNTHIGQPPSNHITLESTIVGNFTTPRDVQLRRINPNGTADAPPFSLPVGQVLLVTDVDWWYRGGTPGQIQILKIDIQNISSGGQSHTVFYSALTLDNQGGAATEAMTSGFIVSSEAKILISNFPGGGVLQDLIIRGYLCPESEQIV